MKKCLYIFCFLIIGQVSASAPKEITVQESLSSKISFTLPEITFPVSCKTERERCSFNPTSDSPIQIGNSTYRIKTIVTKGYEYGMNWDLVRNEKRTVSIFMQEIETNQNYTIWINWSDIAPCLIGKSNSRDSKHKCFVSRKY